MQTAWQFFYWREGAVNRAGESLAMCIERYGVGGWVSPQKDMVAALVFQSAARDAGDSWLLGLKRFGTGMQAEARLYEVDAACVRLAPTSERGAELVALLGACSFERL